MAIQSSINSLLSQAQRLATFYAGYHKAEDFIKGQDNIVKGQKEQTEATKSLQEAMEIINKKREEQFYNDMFDQDGNLSRHGEEEARHLQYRINRGIELSSENNEFYNNPRVQDYLKSFSPNSKLKNEVAGKVARASVEARTASINKTKSNFDEHTASLIRYYSKGSGNP